MTSQNWNEKGNFKALKAFREQFRGLRNIEFFLFRLTNFVHNSIIQQFLVLILKNGDTLKQLLARSRYLLYKPNSKWTENQSRRAKILFEMYPDIEKAYKLCQNLSWIYNQTKDKTTALIRLAKWDEKVRQAKFKSFNSIARTMSIHYQNILNYFDNRSTNASAESFNAKIKAFRAQFRGVRNIEFFLFRLSNIYA